MTTQPKSFRLSSDTLDRLDRLAELYTEAGAYLLSGVRVPPQTFTRTDAVVAAIASELARMESEREGWS